MALHKIVLCRAYWQLYNPKMLSISRRLVLWSDTSPDPLNAPSPLDGDAMNVACHPACSIALPHERFIKRLQSEEGGRVEVVKRYSRLSRKAEG